MASEYDNQGQSGMRSELDEPRRTSEQGMGGMGGDSGYDGVSENEPPHHKIHSEDEPLPKPTSDTYGDDSSTGGYGDQQTSTGGYGDQQTSSGGYGDDKTSSGGYGDDKTTTGGYGDDKTTTGGYGDQQTSTGGYGDDKTSTGGYGGDQSTDTFQDSQTDAPTTQSRSFGGGDKTEGYSDPSSAFPGAPVDRQMQEPGYGQDTTGSEPYSTGTDMGTGVDSPTPKKEGFVQKLKDKLPGGHKSTPTDSSYDDSTTSPMDTGTPKKGLMTKIKEKLPGHHSPTSTDTPPTYE